MAPEDFGRQNWFAAQQLNPKIRFRCFVVKEKKSEQHLGGKREKAHHGQNWIGRDERVS